MNTNTSNFGQQQEPSNQKDSGGNVIGSSNQNDQSKISLPKGGGAIQGIGEKFQVNPVTGTGSLSIPIAMSPGRAGFTPQLALSYDSGAGNSSFGLGWNVGLPSISRKTQKGLPKYNDEKDVFLLSGAEDLVPVIGDESMFPKGSDFTIKRYRPRIEGLFARIEKWTASDGSSFWKSITKENITTIYGQSDDAKIFHPEDNTNVFQWMIERTFDDKGNIIYYQYKEEDGKNIPKRLSEKYRTLYYQRYIKRVFYGNTTPYISGSKGHKELDWNKWNTAANNTWLFELVFDYGEHYKKEDNAPSFEEKYNWSVRPDIFSSFRSGFDIRTYRLCRHILMFHHLEEELGLKNYLVRSTDFRFGENSVATKLEGITHTSYRYKESDEGNYYEKAAMPEVTFKYSEAIPSNEVQEISRENIENLPQGIDGNLYRFQDLYGEGISGILTQSSNAWYYKPNLGNGKFGALEQVAEIPAIANLYQSTQQLMDIDGDGHIDLVIHSQSLAGFFEMDNEGHWENFHAFESNPNLNWRDPNLRLVDLNGDGHADILITENDCFVWYASLAEEGYEAAQRVSKVLEEEKGPRIVFNDGTQSIYLTDMTGDGLTDIVRIKNGNICYWANQGYAQFSPKIEMDNAPNLFDNPELFNQSNIRLSDIDGSGTTDIFYLGKGEVHYWYNESGNAWSKEHIISNFPHIDNLSTVQVIDIKGTGTASLVWSSPLPNEAYAPLKYMDLMQQKPHLLTEINNNMGAITKMEYKASTYFYLDDRQLGNEWITKIPFPVHVLVRQETIDEISGNSFVARYAYHHGYFDGEEREFRGFGLVEQWDTEDFSSIDNINELRVKGTNWSEETDVPPVHTKTWFHTGAFIEEGKISKHFETEYYKKDSDAWLLEDTVIPKENDWTSDEKREACRALKGSVLRQEVYALDGEIESEHPYTVTESNYTIQRLQEIGDNRHGVFLVTPRETLTYHYERNPEDPRIAHSFNLVTDQYGNSTHAASIVYPRRGVEHLIEQRKLYGTLTESLLTHPDNYTDWYRHSLPLESRSFEIHGLEVKKDDNENMLPIAFDDLKNDVFDNFKFPERNEINLYPTDENLVLDFADEPAGDALQLRLLNRSRIKYFNNTLDTPYEEIEDSKNMEFPSLAIPYETYTLAFTKNILEQDAVKGLQLGNYLPKGGYKSSEELFGGSAEEWWIPSGKTLFHYPEDSDMPASRFYFPVGERNPLGKENASNPEAQESYLNYDDYFLTIIEAEDPLGNKVQADKINYRLLQPEVIIDPNDNRSKVAFDIRGMVIASAVLGKGNEGDVLEDFSELHCLPKKGHLTEIMSSPKSHIGKATTYFYYDVFAWKRGLPAHAIGLSREIHFHSPDDSDSRIQKMVSYSDGFGREILTKVQAEPGMAPERDEYGNLVRDNQNNIQYIHTCPEDIATCPDKNPNYPYHRWVGNGKTIFNNKGKPVKQYEPFFDSGYGYTTDDELLEIGVSPTLHYDPLTRVIQTGFPDGTFSKVEFTPWKQQTFDQNDTVLEPNCQWYQERMDSEKKEEDFDPAEILAAQKAAMHANTPTIQHLDTLGRPFVGIAHNRFLENYKNEKSEVKIFIPTHTFSDIEGNPLEIWDGQYCERLKDADEAVIFNLRGQALNPLADEEKHGNCVMTYCYAMGGIPLYQNSMDAGESWTFVNVLGNPIHSWTYKELDDMDNPIFIHNSIEYDVLQRPTHLWVEQEEDRILTERMVYGESLNSEIFPNLKGQLILHFDGAGLIKNTAFDFKSNLLNSSQQLADINYVALKDSKLNWKDIIPNWKDFEVLSTEKIKNILTANHSIKGVVAPELFDTAVSYDALNRPIQTSTPGGSITYQQFNKAGLLNSVHAELPPEKEGQAIISKDFVTNIDYNAKGQRTTIQYGNGVKTTYEYDEKTFRLKCLYSTRKEDSEVLQNIRYYYDPVGNITEIFDEAQPTIFYNNQRIEPRHQYTYDALYQLICANGRESAAPKNSCQNENDTPIWQSNFPLTDLTLRNYRQYYRYDSAGNITKMQHIANRGSWTRNYEYQQDSNRLNNTMCGQQIPNITDYQYDHHGNMTLPHLPIMTWDYKDQLVHTNKNGNGELFFTYDSGRQRVRKLFFHNGGIKERIYLGGYEIYREWDTSHNVLKEELQTLHIMDDTQRICMVETTTLADRQVLTNNKLRHFRYQFSNHLGSAALEVDDSLEAQIITYEEYHPYGTSSFRTRKSGVEISAKRYRYTGMERDEETGLNYHGARYYLSWLGRWLIPETISSFVYCDNDPINKIDLNGKNGIRYWERMNKLLKSIKEKDPYKRERKKLRDQQLLSRRRYESNRRKELSKKAFFIHSLGENLGLTGSSNALKQYLYGAGTPIQIPEKRVKKIRTEHEEDHRKKTLKAILFRIDDVVAKGVHSKLAFELRKKENLEKNEIIFKLEFSDAQCEGITCPRWVDDKLEYFGLKIHSIITIKATKINDLQYELEIINWLSYAEDNYDWEGDKKFRPLSDLIPGWPTQSEMRELGDYGGATPYQRSSYSWNVSSNWYYAWMESYYNQEEIEFLATKRKEYEDEEQRLEPGQLPPPPPFEKIKQ